MKNILILRHAKSSWKEANLPDHERPLNKRGRRDAPQVGALIKQENLMPDLVLCSTARRARETIQAVVDECGYEGEIRYIPDLYHPEVQEIASILGSLDDTIQTVMLVGHNPELEELVNEITELDLHLPTAALALVKIGIRSWMEAPAGLCGELVHFWAPKGQG
jgi:phosphohistidine phosphatase